MIVILSTSIISILLILVSFAYNNHFLLLFLSKDVIPVSGIILPITLINITTIHLNLIEQEQKINKEIYYETKKDLKDNTFLILLCFSIIIISNYLLGFPFFLSKTTLQIICYFFILESFILSLYSTYFICMIVLKIKPLI